MKKHFFESRVAVVSFLFLLLTIGVKTHAQDWGGVGGGRHDGPGSAPKDLSGGAAATIAEAPTLAACYEGMFSGRVPLQSQAGQLEFGQALLALGITAPLSD